MRARNLPPSRRSTSLFVVCQSSCAVFHCLMSAGLFQASHTGFRSAFTRVSTVVFMECLRSFVEELTPGRRTGNPGIDTFSYPFVAKSCFQPANGRGRYAEGT